MSINIFFGINASGKDTIAKEIKRINSKVDIISDSRILMYLLKYIDDFSSEIIIKEDVYKKLENTSQEKIRKIIKTEYRDLLDEFKKSKKTYLLLSHLIFVLTIDKEKPVYLSNDDLLNFYKEFGCKFIQIVSDPKEILRRRNKDKKSGRRDRGNLDSLSQIKKHQQMCGDRWYKFFEVLPENKRLTVINDDISTTVDLINDFIK